MSMTSLQGWTTRCCLLVATLLVMHPRQECLAAGVTVITHGLDGNTDGWVTGMANRIPAYGRFPGTNYTFYKFYFYLSGGSYYLTWSRLGGSLPSTTDSGEIIVAFDWSQLADGNSYNTYQIAPVLDSALRSTNFVSELNGHALAELPIHLIGHSRGGSLMCQTSLLLGTNGVWVDHLSTLDPHPLNDPNFPLDGLLYSAIDAPCATYENTLFHDNTWENIGLVVYGEPVSGACVRQLYNVSGGYQNIDTHYPHSNVHLWYHGSVDLRNPASDTEATITSAERTNWWTAYEDFGVSAGFYYSLIGGGSSRFSPAKQSAGAELEQRRLHSAIRAHRHRPVHQRARRDESLHQFVSWHATVLSVGSVANKGLHVTRTFLSLTAPASS